MAKLSAVYAKALFDMFLSRENAGADADSYLAQAVFLRDLLREPDCRRILVHPHITSTEKRSFFDNILSETVEDGKLDSDLTGLLYLAIQKNREAFLADAYAELIPMVEKYKRVARAKVISAAPLTEAQVSSLAAMLERKLDKHVKVEQNIDPGLIGGMYIYVDGYFIDRTIKSQLRGMKSSIIEGGGM